MSQESQPSPDKAIRALTGEVAECIRRGEKVRAIRAELLADGLEPALVDHILADAAVETTSRWRTPVGMILSVVILLACAGAGLAGGVWAAIELPPAPGLAVMVTCLFSVILVILGGALGVSIGLGITALLAKWTVRDDDLENYS